MTTGQKSGLNRKRPQWNKETPELFQLLGKTKQEGAWISISQVLQEEDRGGGRGVNNCAPHRSIGVLDSSLYDAVGRDE